MRAPVVQVTNMAAEDDSDIPGVLKMAKSFNQRIVDAFSSYRWNVVLIPYLMHIIQWMLGQEIL